MSPPDERTLADRIGEYHLSRPSRRGYLGLVAAVGGVGLAGCSSSEAGGGGSNPTTTAPVTTEGTTTGDPATEAPMEVVDPDVSVLNYALTLEHLENAFYRDGLAEFADDELAGAEVLSRFDETVRMQVPGYLSAVGAHEAAHVEAIAATVTELGGEPVAEAEYDFGYETPSEFLGVAMALENTGVAAYAGAAPMVRSNAILAAAAGIHSVEARHASFLNLLNSTSPFPAAVDEAKSMEEVLEIAGQFVTSGMDDPEMTDESAMGGDGGMEEAEPERKADDGTSDVDVLNYALTLEHLENAFYRDGLAEFADDELVDASVLSEYGDEIRSAVPGHLAAIGAHEAAHVEAITATVEQLGGEPVAEAEYDFGYETPSEFLGVARALENTGVSAYASAAPSVTNGDVFAAALGIHSVEARHASFLNELNVASPFPNGVDEPRTMEEVVDIAGQFIVG